VKYFGDSGDLANRKGWYYEDSKYVLKDGKGYRINDQNNSKRMAKYRNGAWWWWWLRSPGFGSGDAALVHSGGALYVFGFSVNGAGGVRPALWLDLIHYHLVHRDA
jgi:hypothetical protein